MKHKKKLTEINQTFGFNLLKSDCILGAKDRASGKKKKDNPKFPNTKSYRRWERGFENADKILGILAEKSN